MNRHDRRRGARHKGAPVALDPIRATALAGRLLDVAGTKLALA
jgi:hypothetical protein